MDGKVFDLPRIVSLYFIESYSSYWSQRDATSDAVMKESEFHVLIDNLQFFFGS